MKTYLDVLNETVEFYSKDPVGRRSLTGEGGNTDCMYNGPDGKKCAFARCAKPIPKVYEGSWAKLVLRERPNILKKEYKHLNNSDFWLRLQSLHDMNSNWTEFGLSVRGEKVVIELEEWIKENTINKD